MTRAQFHNVMHSVVRSVVYGALQPPVQHFATTLPPNCAATGSFAATGIFAANFAASYAGTGIFAANYATAMPPVA
eukprot:gene11636-biopygen2985